MIKSQERESKGVAFLYDESFLWRLMAYEALTSNNLPFELITAEDIRKGCLRNYRMLFVPGGWASNKLKALKEKGVEEIRDFVGSGGIYFGICGGAGLATHDGIGLLDIKRKPTIHRVPSFSGRIYLNLKESFLWKGIKIPIFYAWWPSQFIVKDPSIKILATFGDALHDAFSSDINVGDMEDSIKWQELERIYGINLDPAKLKDEPAVVEGYYGDGRVILSLLHFDTPYDENGLQVLKNLWQICCSEVNSELAQIKKGIFNELPVCPVRQSSPLSEKDVHPGQASRLSEKDNRVNLLQEMESMVEELIDFGIRNFLWFWRSKMLLQWRRGVRGLEYCTLFIMIRELRRFEDQFTEEDIEKLKVLRKILISFVDKAKRLLIRERFIMQNTHISYGKCDDPEIQALRKELFGDSKSHGGFLKEILDKIDKILFKHLKNATLGSLRH